MIVRYEKEVSGVFMEYFKELLQNYMADENEGIYEFLLRRIREEFAPVVEKILFSIQFLSFYYAIEHINETKVNTKREEVFKRTEEFKDMLVEFLKGETFPKELVKKAIYSTETMKNSQIYESFPRVYDKTEKVRIALKKECNRFLMKSILDIGEILKKMGILKGMLSTANNKSRFHYLGGIKFDYGEASDTIKIKDMIEYLEQQGKKFWPKNAQEMFSSNYLEGLKTQELVFVNLFWSNKLAKIIENLLFYASFFANRKTLLWGVKIGDVSLDTIFHYLDTDKKNMKTEHLLFELKKFYEKGEVDDSYLEEDIREMLPIYELLGLSYILKDICIFSAFKTEGQDKTIKNYGVVESSLKNSYTFAYVWDLPHMNLPITIHLAKTSLIYYFSKMNKQEKIRLYIGEEDFFSKDKDKVWKNSFLYPIHPEKVDYIKLKSCNDQIKHILFLQNGIWPKHMRSSNGKVSKRYITIDELKKSVNSK